MLYYKVLDRNNGSVKGAICLNDFRFYHPERERMFITTQLAEAQYIIFNGEYYRVPWLKADDFNKNKYPEVDLVLIEKEEYEKYMK